MTTAAASDLDLLTLRAGQHATLDARGRIVGSAGASLLVACDGVRVVLGDALPQRLGDALRDAAGRSPVPDDPADTALLDELSAIVREHAGDVRIEGGPA